MRGAALAHQLAERSDDVGRTKLHARHDREALSTEAVDDGQQPEALAAREPVRDKVRRPRLVRCRELSARRSMLRCPPASTAQRSAAGLIAAAATGRCPRERELVARLDQCAHKVGRAGCWKSPQRCTCTGVGEGCGSRFRLRLPPYPVAPRSATRFDPYRRTQVLSSAPGQRREAPGSTHSTPERPRPGQSVPGECTTRVRRKVNDVASCRMNSQDLTPLVHDADRMLILVWSIPVTRQCKRQCEASGWGEVLASTYTACSTARIAALGPDPQPLR